MKKYGCYPTDFHQAHITSSRSSNGRLLLALVISLLAHLLAMLWLGDSSINNRSSVSTIDRTLTVNIIHPPSPVMKSSSIDSQSIQREESQPAVHRSQPMPAKRKKKNATVDSEHGAVKIKADAIKQQIYDSIPSILEGMEKLPLDSKQPTIFDPRLRKAIDNSRREEVERQRKKSSLNTASHIQVTGTYDDYIGVRINKRCWKVPTDSGQDKFSVKIWMVDFTCPERKNRLFENIKR